jgi:hypothetical protein
MGAAAAGTSYDFVCVPELLLAENTRLSNVFCALRYFFKILLHNSLSKYKQMYSMI